MKRCSMGSEWAKCYRNPGEKGFRTGYLLWVQLGQIYSARIWSLKLIVFVLFSCFAWFHAVRATIVCHFNSVCIQRVIWFTDFLQYTEQHCVKGKETFSKLSKLHSPAGITSNLCAWPFAGHTTVILNSTAQFIARKYYIVMIGDVISMLQENVINNFLFDYHSQKLNRKCF